MFGRVAIFNIYNPCDSDKVKVALNGYLQRHSPGLYRGNTNHMIWAGDFNRHHPLWGRDEDIHLFTRPTLNAADKLIELIGKYRMVMTLPKGLTTLQHMATKRFSRPDNVFCMANLLDLFTKCNVDYDSQPASTDHYPIKYIIELEKNKLPEQPTRNFQTTNWEDFNKNLKIRLQDIAAPCHLESTQELSEAVKALTEALQNTIKTRIKLQKPIPEAKH